MVKRKEERGTFLEKEVKSIAPFLLIIGVIQIIFSSYLSAGWGVILLIVGIASFFYPREWMYLGFGIGLIIIGISNMSVSTDFWIIFGVIQIALGIYVIIRYNKLKKKNKKKLTGGQKFLIILGIVLLSVVALFAISFIELLFYPSYEYEDDSKTDGILESLTKYEYEEERIEEMLIEDGYDILLVSVSNYSKNAPFFEWYNIEDNTICEPGETYCLSDKVSVIVEMKSLGNRNDQIWDFLIVSNIIYSNAFTYKANILTPTETCEYVFFGDLMDEYFATYDPEIRGLLEEYMANPKLCS